MFKKIVQGHTANTWKSQDLNPGGLVSESMLYNSCKVLASFEVIGINCTL